MTFGRALARIVDFYLNFYVYVKNKSWFFRETFFLDLGIFFVRRQGRGFVKNTDFCYDYMRFLMFFGGFVYIK